MTASQLIATVALGGLLAAPLAARAETVSGRVVDLATYMTHDHNMDAMHGSAMKGDAMKGDAMKGEHECPPTFGLVTNGGASVVLLVTQMGTASVAKLLCADIGKTVSIGGRTYVAGGMRAMLVSSIK